MEHRSGRGRLPAFALIAVFWCGSASARVWYVNRVSVETPRDGSSFARGFQQIQPALNAAQAGDQVRVAKGTYPELLTMPASVALYGGFSGSETQRSQRDWRSNLTVILGQQGMVAITFSESGAVVDGFSIRKGSAAIRVQDCDATVANCDVSVLSNDGIQVLNGTVSMYRNEVSACTRGVLVSSSGADAYAAAILFDNAISANVTGIHAEDGSLNLVNNTVTGNVDGILLDSGAARLVNNIIAFNSRAGIRSPAAVRPLVSSNNVYGNGANYSGVPDSTGEDGNLSLDPKLSSIYHDSHIQPDSPCRDAGDSDAALGAADIDGQARLMDGRVDIGADESDGQAQVTPGRVWFVSTSGDDGSDGASWATAKRTIQARLETARGGDEVWVAQGTYAEHLFAPAGVGLYGGFTGSEASKSQRDPAANPTIVDGGGQATPVITFNRAGAVVDGFVLQNSSEGVWVENGEAAIRNNRITNCGLGVLVLTGSAEITGNTIISNRASGVAADANLSFPSEATLTGNIIRDNQQDGIAVGNATVTVDRNFISINKANGITVGGTGRAVITSNLISRNTGRGVAILVSSDARLHNNTVVSNGAGVSATGTVTAVLVNNIIAFSTGDGISQTGITASLTMNRNDVFGNTPNYLGVSVSTAGNISANPLFVNPAVSNYHLQAASPCRDAGDNSVVEPGALDIVGNARLMGPHVDIGAYEVVTAGLLTFADVVLCLRIAGGEVSASSTDLSRLDLVDPATQSIGLPDAIRIARQVAGLE